MRYRVVKCYDELWSSLKEEDAVRGLDPIFCDVLMKGSRDLFHGHSVD